MSKRNYGFITLSLMLAWSVTEADAKTLASGLLYGGTAQTGFACTVINVSTTSQVVFNPRVLNGTVQFNTCGGPTLNTAVTLAPNGTCSFTGTIGSGQFAQCAIGTGPLTAPSTLRGSIDVRTNNGTVVLQSSTMR
jgi:hypothetical protein